jgi:hypothetical protein
MDTAKGGSQKRSARNPGTWLQAARVALVRRYWTEHLIA